MLRWRAGVKAHECCGHDACSTGEVRTANGGPRLHTAGRRGAKAAGWVLPSAVMILMPKCPACVVAYVAIATGAGISVSMAAHLRLIVLMICVAVLLWLAAKPLLRVVRG